MRVIFLAALLARLLKPLSLDSFRLRRPSLQFAVGSAFMWKSGRRRSRTSWDLIGRLTEQSYVKREAVVVVVTLLYPTLIYTHKQHLGTVRNEAAARQYHL